MKRLDVDRATAFLLAVNDLCEEHGYSIRRGITLNEWNEAPGFTVNFVEDEEPERASNRRRIGAEMRADLDPLLEPYDWGPGGIPEGTPFNLADYPPPHEQE